MTRTNRTLPALSYGERNARRWLHRERRKLATATESYNAGHVGADVVTECARVCALAYKLYLSHTHKGSQ